MYEGVSEMFKCFEVVEFIEESWVMMMKGERVIFVFCELLLLKVKNKIVILFWFDIYNELKFFLL